ncbi:MAG: putative porin [Rhodospirillales bacterium]|nr:putative porin [Acetobacter sp.]
MHSFLLLSTRTMTRLTARPAAGLVIALVVWLLGARPLHSADPYDKSLEARVEALERELNAMSSDSKGKDLNAPDVPTFLRAAGKQVQQLTISGDLRFRYNYQNEDFQYPGAGNQQQTSRYLYRLRLNLNYTFNDRWFAAVGVSTNGAADSGNQQITEGFDDFGVYLHQFMLGWKATDFLTLELGKIFVPFYNNSDGLVNWSNINPTGLTELVNFDLTPQLNVKANFGQYVFYDNPESGYGTTTTRLATTNAAGTVTGSTTVTSYTTNPAGAVVGNRHEDAIFYYQDIVATYKPSRLVTLIVSPAFYFYAPHGSVGVSGNAVGPAGGRSNPNAVNTANPLAPSQGALLGTANFNGDNATRCLYVGFLDGELQFPVGPIKGKFYWDFAYNFEGGQRDYQIFGVQEDGFLDKQSWIAGVQLGEPKRKGDWYASAEYHQVGLGSTDPNLNDTNFGLSRLNTQGIRLAVGYNLEEWLRLEVWYYGAWNLEKDLHDLRGTRLTGANIRTFYDENASQNLIVQLTAGF